MTATNALARLYAATKNAAAVLLVQRIRLYCSFKNGGVWYEGRHWSHRSIAQWGEETSVSGRTTRRLMKLLRDANLVSNRMAWVGAPGARRWVLHTALTKRAEAIFSGVESEEMAGGDDQMWPEGVTNSGQGVIPDLAAPIYNPIDLPEDHLKDLPSDQLSAVAKTKIDSSKTEAGGDEEGKQEKEVEPEKEGKDAETAKLDAPQTDAKEPGMKMVENFETEGWKTKPMKLLHKPDTPSYYGWVWREALNQAGQVCPTLLLSDLKTLKRIADQCQPASGEAVLRFIVANWSKYAAQAKLDTGYTWPVPTLPSAKFILNRTVTAVMMMATPTPPKQQEALMAISIEKSVQSSAPPVTPPCPPKQTLDEIYSDPDEE